MGKHYTTNVHHKAVERVYRDKTRIWWQKIASQIIGGPINCLTRLLRWGQKFISQSVLS